MPDTRNYYVLCDDNCRFPAMTAEQILEAIAEATGNTPQHVEDAFITQIKNQNTTGNLKLWKGTEAQYNALETHDADTIYLIDTNTVRSIENYVSQSEFEAHEESNGSSTDFGHVKLTDSIPDDPSDPTEYPTAADGVGASPAYVGSLMAALAEYVETTKMSIAGGTFTGQAKAVNSNSSDPVLRNVVVVSSGSNPSSNRVSTRTIVCSRS